MTNPVFEVNSAALTDAGRKRPHNEDFVAFFEPDDAEELSSSGNLYIVADGVGGAAKGERASQYAAQKVLYEYYRPPQIEPDERLGQSMRSACKEIHAYSQRKDSPSRMATTMVAAVVRGQTLTVANVGDSRAYLIRNGRIDQITQDHTFVGEMVRSGVMTEEEAQRSKRKNRLSRSLGGESDVKVDTFPNLTLKTGDRILLCSDGLTRYTTQEDLVRLAGTGSPTEVVERLIKFANSQGGADNISAILIVVGQLVNVADAIKIKSRGPAPTPVDWETMATEVAPISRKTLPQLILQKQYLPLVFAGVVIMCVFGIIGIAVSPKDIISGSSASETVAASRPNSVILELTSTVGTPSPTITLTQVSVTNEIVETPTLQSNITPEMTNVLETGSEDPGLCEYTINNDDDTLGIDHIKEKLNVRDIGYEAIQCKDQQPLECNFNSESRDYIEPGWILIFPNVLPSVCEENEGLVVSEPD